MSYLKRQKAPKKWPIGRKGFTYIVRPNFSIYEGVPLLIVLRDMLKVAQTRKEVKRIIHMKQVLVNEKPARDENNNILLFDTLVLVPLKKYYKMELSDKGKFYLHEIKESEANRKISKIVNKKVLRKKKTQLNLSDGRNILSDIKCDTNDSVVINFKGGKIEKCLPLKEKENVIVFAGKHTGKKGKIIKLDLENKTARIKVSDYEINILIKQMMVTE